MSKPVTETPLNELISKYPYAEDFLISIGLQDYQINQTLSAYIERLSESLLEDIGMSKRQIISGFASFIRQMEALKSKSQFQVKSITIIGGYDKSGNKEDLSCTIKTGDIICIVGSTGAGKSRLLADIECLAQKDTPTGRQLLINDAVPEAENRFNIENKLVAQLSQNMNFIMDLSVGEFITMHAESRMIENIDAVVQTVFTCANALAGEKFNLNTPVTSLSGGQSRALMIADAALLSSSPVVLIDEIENAGVDREKALALLVKEEKIVLMTTHDPILALMGQRRMVIKNGGISKIINTTAQEKANLMLLQQLNQKLIGLRNLLRAGEKIDFDVRDMFRL